jgi:hypothetical protein
MGEIEYESDAERLCQVVLLAIGPYACLRGVKTLCGILAY